MCALPAWIVEQRALRSLPTKCGRVCDQSSKVPGMQTVRLGKTDLMVSTVGMGWYSVHPPHRSRSDPRDPWCP
jgi:hypothetical protein